MELEFLNYTTDVCASNLNIKYTVILALSSLALCAAIASCFLKRLLKERK